MEDFSSDFKLWSGESASLWNLGFFFLSFFLFILFSFYWSLFWGRSGVCVRSRRRNSLSIVKKIWNLRLWEDGPIDNLLFNWFWFPLKQERLHSEMLVLLVWEIKKRSLEKVRMRGFCFDFSYVCLEHNNSVNLMAGSMSSMCTWIQGCKSYKSLLFV